MSQRTTRDRPQGLYKRKGSKNYYADLGRDSRGRRLRRSTGTSDEKEAKGKYELWVIEENLKRINPSKFMSKPEYPFALAVKAQAEHLKRKNERSFLSSDRYRLNILLGYFENIPCHKIDRREIQAFINKRSDDGVSEGTIKRDVTILSAILHRAYEDEFIDRKPRVPSLKGSKPSDRTLEFDEEERLLFHAPPHLKSIIIFALETGARKGEILSLDWRNVDLKKRRIKFVNTKNGKDRVIPMTNACYDLLYNQDRHLAGPVFGVNGRAIKDIKTSYQTAKRKAGIDGLTFHHLRHTFASRFISKGGQQQALMTILGHSSSAMTQKYTHLSVDYLADAMAIMNEAASLKEPIPHIEF